jgi:flagellin
MPVINTNAAANSAVMYLNINSSQETSALEKLSSGSNITQASDNAAGLAIATNISADITTLQQAATNASQATSILQIADGGASNISDILARMTSLASESASGTTTDTSRDYINAEFTQLVSEIDSIASATSYSGQNLLDGSSAFSSGVSVLVGTSSSDQITITLSNLTSSSLGIASLDVTTLSGATSAMTALSSAINSVSAARAEIGAQESRFNFSASAISTQTQNLQTAESAIMDVDVASEQATLSSAEVKTQAAVSAETAANQMPQYLLKLLS